MAKPAYFQSFLEVPQQLNILPEGWAGLGKAGRLLPWPLILAVICAGLIFRNWYLTTGLLTFGDLGLARLGADAQNSMGFWRFDWQIGGPDVAFFWIRFYFACLGALHISTPVAERIIFFYAVPPLLIAGTYMLAQALLEDSIGAGIVSLSCVLNTDFLVRSIGGHATALMPIALAPWSAYFAIRVCRDGRKIRWSALIFLSMCVSASYDSRWAALTLLLVMVVALSTVVDRKGNVRRMLLALALAALGLMCANLPWLVPTFFGMPVSPAPPASHFDPRWIALLSLANIWDGLTLWNPAFVSDFDGGALQLSHAPWYEAWIPLLIVLGVMRRKSRTVLIPFIMYLLLAFAYKGSQAPAGFIYSWFFVHVPFFDLYREPLKVGSTLGILGSLCIAYFVTSLRPPGIRAMAALFVSIILIGTSYPAFWHSGSGTMHSRTAPQRYTKLQSFLARDRSFGRVLWLPDVPRWLTPVVDHPFSDGVELGLNQFAQFRYDPSPTSDPLSFMIAPFAGNLLSWYGFEYVIVDPYTQTDATYATNAQSFSIIDRRVRALPNAIEIASFQGIKIYRIERGPMPLLMSSKRVDVFYGDAIRMGAAALARPHGAKTPVVLSADSRVNIPIGARIVAGPDALERTFEQPAESEHRVLLADSVLLGPQSGDSIVAASVRLSSQHIVSVFPGRLTIAGASVVEALSPRTVSVSPTIVPVSNVPIFENPTINVNSASGPGDGRYTLAFDLRDAARNRQWFIKSSQDDLPYTNLNLRDYIFNWMRRLHPRGLNVSNYEELLLRRIYLQWNAKSKQKVASTALALSVDDPFGKRVFAARSLKLTHLGCSRCLHLNGRVGSALQMNFAPRVRKHTFQKGDVIALNAFPGPLTGVVDETSNGRLSGVSLLGKPFSIKSSVIDNLNDAPDSAAVRLPVPANISKGTLLVRVAVSDPSLDLKLAVAVRSAGLKRWVLRDFDAAIIDSNQRTARFELDYARSLLETPSIDSVFIVVQEPAPLKRSFVLSVLRLAVLNGPAVREAGPTNGGSAYITTSRYTVRHLSTGLCSRCVVIPATRSLKIDFRPRIAPTLRVGDGVALHEGARSETGIIVSGGTHVSGISVFGSRFVISSAQLHTYAGDAPDVCAIPISSDGQPFTRLRLRAQTTDHFLTFRWLVNVKVAGRARWVMLPAGESRGQSVNMDVETDLRSLLSTGGNILAMYAVVARSGGAQPAPVKLRLAVDALNVRDTMTSIALREGQRLMGDAFIESTLAQNTQIAYDLRAGRDVENQVQSAPVQAASSMRFTDFSHFKFLLFNESFDTGWQLLDHRERPVGTRLKFFGGINGWYLPNGLDGEYTVVFKPAPYAAIGARLAIWACLFATALVFLSLLQVRKRRQG